MTHPYASEAYASALAGSSEYARLNHLKTCTMLRPIPDTSFVDAVGPYPLTPLSCPPSNVDAFSELQNSGAVSVTFVTDALQPDTDWFSEYFDFARPYKLHYLVDRRIDTPSFSSHHRYEVKQALTRCQIKTIDLADYLDEWIDLYDVLVRRHELTGTHAFSRAYFEQLAQFPELITIGAFVEDTLVSCHLWLVSGQSAYSHLAASNEAGYDSGAAYAIYDHAVSTLNACDVIDLGGGAGISNSSDDGLARFKRGFSNAENKNWICGMVLNRDLYEQLCAETDSDPDSKAFFPAYRSPER